ncbi:MBL fold metallo-hydrolase, partial [Salmonella sp. s60131]|uniref:MBL fold metallo-hydrolase n=1 Tax=Salmonella sp. s60131 TaxID=3159722 RepID=UPI003980A677
KAITEVAGMRSIDHLIITHYHGDHFGGAADLATLLPIKNMYDNGKFADMPNDPGKAYFELKCEHRAVINPGDRLELKQSAGEVPQISLTCLGT